jgi:hypothetical protein
VSAGEVFINTPRGRVEQQRVTLPRSVMTAIAAVATHQPMLPHERLEAVLWLIYGWAWYDRQESVDPTAIAIPSTQWHTISTFLMRAPKDDPIDSVNLALSFMNSGPSAFDE